MANAIINVFYFPRDTHIFIHDEKLKDWRVKKEI